MQGARARRRGRGSPLAAALAMLACLPWDAVAQRGAVDYGGRLGQQRASEVAFRPQGPTVMMGAIDPARHTWYMPQELFEEHPFRQWQTTSYLRPYQRYVNPSIEGDYYYDVYGNYLAKGWLLYSIEQTAPEELGSAVFKDGRFGRWFSDVVVASDQKGQYSYSLTVANDLRTTFTPMVLTKPRMDGLQIDAASDKYETTLVFSRLSGPRGGIGQDVRRTSTTSLLAGRVTAQVGDFVRLGFHNVNAHQTNSTRDREVLRSLVTGSLNESQNQETVSTVEIVLRDDSPADGVGGAAFFPDASDILIHYADGSVDSGSDMRFRPVVAGGLPQPGYLSADGNEEIRLTYDFNSPGFVNRAAGDKGDITEVELRLVLGNDYQVWMTSDRQTDAAGNPVLLLVAQAEGNVRDLSNLRTVSFDYGLPTATNVAGATIEVTDVLGLRLYGEYDASWTFRQYPNIAREIHESSSGIVGARTAPAWMLNASKQEGRWFGYAEAYSIDPRYSTTAFIPESDGDIDYAADRNKVELVEDNDDQDRFPDWFRGDWNTPDLQVFPGWDTNGDFVVDLNQNDNRVKLNAVPDYEEPFLRFHVDRPEFLFGVDMNNNFWPDLYENDQAPDYPYPRDHEGYNAYAGIHLTSNLKVMAGILREELISSDQRNHSTYGMVHYYGSSPRFGRLRVFEMVKRVEDDIADPLLQWAPDNTILGGRLTPVEDPMLAPDTWVNQLFVGHALNAQRLEVTSKLNYLLFHQRLGDARRLRLNLDRRDFFFGLVNKASYRLDAGPFVVEPRWKSEFLKQSRSLFAAEERSSLRQLAGGLAEVGVLAETRLQAGLEYVYFRDYEEDSNDFTSTILGFQFSNVSAYQGYRITALAGIVVERRDPRGEDAFTSTQTFVTVYAGL